MAGSGSNPAAACVTVQPSLFDMYYEEFLAQFMSAADPNEISQEFMKLKTDIERADFIMRLPFVIYHKFQYYMWLLREVSKRFDIVLQNK